MDEAYLNIKMDKDTNQYTIGSPVTLNIQNQSPVEPGRRSKLMKANYSLSENHHGDDRGMKIVYHFTNVYLFLVRLFSEET